MQKPHGDLAVFFLKATQNYAMMWVCPFAFLLRGAGAGQSRREGCFYASVTNAHEVYIYVYGVMSLNLDGIVWRTSGVTG
jgi:hypothetical protein